MEPDPVIVLENVQVEGSAGKPRLEIQELNFTAGKITAIVGPSGSGKSTLIKTCLGFEPSTKGSVIVSGYEVVAGSKLTLRKLRSQTGYVQQSANLIERITALENVLIGTLSQLRFPRIGVSTYPLWARKKALELLRQLGLDNKTNDLVRNLSGGQKQRLAIARALMHEPKVIFADEPISALDQATSEKIMQIFRQLTDDYGITVIVALHQLEFALKFADEIVVFSEGNVVQHGDANEFDVKTLLKYMR